MSRGCSGRVRLSQGSGCGGCVRATSHLSLPENELEEAQVGGETEAWHRPLRSSALCGRPREPVRGSEQGRLEQICISVRLIGVTNLSGCAHGGT